MHKEHIQTLKYTYFKISVKSVKNFIFVLYDKDDFEFWMKNRDCKQLCN